MHCVVKEVVNCAVCESRDKESGDEVTESELVRNGGNQCCAKETSCAGTQFRSGYELSAGVEEACVVGVHQQVDLVGKFWEHEGAGDAVSVKGRLARNVSFWRDVVQAP